VYRVRLALVRVTSENLKRVDLSGCHHISAGGMQDILQYLAETCSGVEEVDVTACSSETILRAVATRARAALATPKPVDMFVLLRSLGEADISLFVFKKKSRGGKICYAKMLNRRLLGAHSDHNADEARRR
jgi:hypothetical protein